MPINSLGDMSQSFQSMRQTGAIKDRVQTLSAELASGRISDLTTALRGDGRDLAAIDRDLSVLAVFAETNAGLARRLSSMQAVLSSVDDMRIGLATDVVRITPSSTSLEIRNAAARARTDFTALVGRINTRDGDQALLAGRAVDRAPLAAAEDMLDDIVASLGGATDEATIRAGINFWFDDPGGGFATMGYLGDTGDAPTRRISDTETLTLAARADDPGVKAVLKAAATAAVTDLMGPALTRETQAALVRDASEQLLSAATPLTDLRGRVGMNEERIAEAQTAQAAQQAALATARNDLTLADPFETATALQDVQRQLELHFATTARLSRLSLVNYL